MTTTAKKPMPIDTLEEAIDDVTTAVEDVHRAIAGLPLEILGSIEPLRDAMKSVRGVQERSLHAIYGTVRKVNHRVHDLLAGEEARA